MCPSTLASTQDDFPITKELTSRLHSLAINCKVSSSLVFQEARLVEWKLSQETFPSKEIKYKYFWVSIRNNVLQQLANDQCFVRSTVVEKGKKKRVLKQREFVSLDEVFDTHGEAGLDFFGIINSRSFEEIYQEDYINALVSFIKEIIEQEKRVACHDSSFFSIVLEMLYEKISHCRPWKVIREQNFSHIPQTTFGRYTKKLEKYTLAFVLENSFPNSPSTGCTPTPKVFGSNGISSSVKPFVPLSNHRRASLLYGAKNV